MILENLSTVLKAIAVCVWIHWLWSRRDFYKFALNFNTVWGLPLLGVAYHIPAGAWNMIKFINNILIKQAGNTLFTWVGTHPFFFTLEPDLLESIFTSPDLLTKARTMYKPISDCAFDGLITLPVDVWQQHRKVINQSFNHKVLRSLLGVFDKLKRRLVKEFEMLDDGQEHSIFDIIQNKSIAAAFEATMGTDIDTDKLKAIHIAENIDDMEDGVNTHLQLSFLKLGWISKFNRKFQRSRKNVIDFIKSVADAKLMLKMKNAVESQKEEEKQGENVISIEKNPGIFIDQAIEFYKKGQFTYDDIIVESNHVLIASYDSTKMSYYAAVLMLAMHSDVQERVFEEICTIFPDKNFQLGPEHIDQLPYFDMVFNEVMRLVPAFPLIARMAVKDTKINSDIIIPKNTEIVISIFHLHRSKDIWGKNADKFDPDNFLPETVSRRHAYAYMPFSKGARNCIGWRYAQLSAKALLAGLIRNFRFSTDFKYENLEFVFSMSLQLKVKPKIKIEKRQ